MLMISRGDITKSCQAHHIIKTVSKRMRNNKNNIFMWFQFKSVKNELENITKPNHSFYIINLYVVLCSSPDCGVKTSGRSIV